MKGNKGITLIALIVTIIVLIILAGVAIMMLAGDNGILNQATKAKYDTIVASFDEQVKLAQTSLRMKIQTEMTTAGYLATGGEGETVGKATYAGTTNFDKLVREVSDELGAKADYAFNFEGFSVNGYLDTLGTDTVDGHGYILITYSNNALRASLPSSATTAFSCNGIDYTKTTAGVSSVNQAVLAYVIKISNYGCELSAPIITDKKNLVGTDGTSGDWAKTAFSATDTKTAIASFYE